MCLNIKILQMFGLIQTNMSNFHPLEVVDRGSETQLQVGEDVSYLFSFLTHQELTHQDYILGII